MKDEGIRMKRAVHCVTLCSLLRTLLILHPAALLLSCASLPELPWAPVSRDASAGFYDSARLEYRIDAGKLGQPLNVVRVDGQQVGYEQIASSPLANQSWGTLIIQKPHPAGLEGMARVTFTINSESASSKTKSSWSWLPGNKQATPIGHQEEVHETWAMDVPSAEADRYFSLLSNQNFYNGTPHEKAAAEITVTMDGRQVRKTWEPLPELDALARQVRSQGQLVAYLRPQALAGQPGRTIASVQAYKDLLAKTGSPPAGPIEDRGGATVARLPYAAR
jgi:hypothetical protein